MSSSGFLKIDGVIGESYDSNHKGWIDVERFDLEATQNGSMSKGGGGGTGKVNYSDLTIFTYVDKATPAIFNYAASGKHISKVELAIHKAGGDSQIEYMRIVMEDVIVTAASYDGMLVKSPIPIIYKFQAARIFHKYWEQMNSGQRGAEICSGWDLKKNCPI